MMILYSLPCHTGYILSFLSLLMVPMFTFDVVMSSADKCTSLKGTVKCMLTGDAR